MEDSITSNADPCIIETCDSSTGMITTAPKCDDDNPCTRDECNPLLATGCDYPADNEGSPCSLPGSILSDTGVCEDGECVEPISPPDWLGYISPGQCSPSILTTLQEVGGRIVTIANVYSDGFITVSVSPDVTPNDPESLNEPSNPGVSLTVCR